MKIGIWGMGERFSEDGRGLRLLDLVYTYDEIICSELEQNRKGMIEFLVEKCRKIGLKGLGKKIRRW